jgi:hypothetical protein
MKEENICALYMKIVFTVKNKPSVGWDALRTTKERLGRQILLNSGITSSIIKSREAFIDVNT